MGNADSEEIRELLRDGTGLVTFLGHGSSSVLDYNVNNPSIWDNKGKYPIFNAMGCSAGQIHKNYRSLAEVFVLESTLPIWVVVLAVPFLGERLTRTSIFMGDRTGPPAHRDGAGNCNSTRVIKRH